jgi:hypothetical protein
MTHSNQLIPPLFLVLSFFPVGCFSNAATPRKGTRPDSPRLAAVDSSRPPASSAPKGDSSISVYTDPEDGTLLRYPRYYALLETDPEDGAPDLRTQQALAEEQPGSILLATILIPGDAYPNTTFVGGSLQFALNRSVTPQACRDLPIARGGDVGTITIQNVLFTWEQDASATPDTDQTERDYAGFVNDTCYEFFLRVRSGEAQDEDGAPKAADSTKILRHLEKIVLSLQLPGRSSLQPATSAP